MIRHQYYAMKNRLGGMKLTPRDKLVMHHWYPCPGCIPHEIQPQRRKDILFEHYINRPRKAYAVYWRMHPKEYEALLARPK